jgi:hypothetical protein
MEYFLEIDKLYHPNSTRRSFQPPNGFTFEVHAEIFEKYSRDSVSESLKIWKLGEV